MKKLPYIDVLLTFFFQLRANSRASNFTWHDKIKSLTQIQIIAILDSIDQHFPQAALTLLTYTLFVPPMLHQTSQPIHLCMDNSIMMPCPSHPQSAPFSCTPSLTGENPGASIQLMDGTWVYCPSTIAATSSGILKQRQSVLAPLYFWSTDILRS